MDESAVAIVLAAGKSTRMKSEMPKVLHAVCGRPMIDYVLDAAREAGVRRLVVVVGHQAEQVKAALSGQSDVEFALQSEQKGTGHAVLMCQNALRQHHGPVFVLTGDAPLMRSESFLALLQEYRQFEASCVIGTAKTKNNNGLGRIVRNTSGAFLRIVEEKDASDEEKQIEEVNVGCYVFDCQSLFEALDRLTPNNKQGEYYLTDCAAIIKDMGKRVVASLKLDISEALGVNTREQLADIERFMQRKTHSYWLVNGVTILNPDLTYIDPRAVIGKDTVIHPFTTIDGKAKIGSNCRIGPHAVLQGATIGDGQTVGPFELRKG